MEEDGYGRYRVPRYGKSILLAVLLAGATGASPAFAQAIAPSQVTPRDLAPAQPRVPESPLRQPEFAPVAPPAEAAFAVDTGEAMIDGGFPEMAESNAAFMAGVGHRHLTLADLYEAAGQLEQAYARRGFILARVSVPPQRLAPGGPVRVAVTDGFIEALDLAHLANPLRAAVQARVQPLVGRRHLTQATIERALLLAGDLAGARLRSAIVPGTAAGGVELVVEGRLDRVELQANADNSLPAALGSWQFSASLAITDVLRAGDQLYLTAGSQFDVGRFGGVRSPLGMIGGGLVLPVSASGLTLAGEYLASRTQPIAAPGTPQSIGEYERGLVRLHLPLILDRRQQLAITGTVELTSQSLSFPEFGLAFSRDHYATWRMGVDWRKDFARTRASLVATLSQGLAGRAATTALPFSRQGTDNHFTRLEGTARLTMPLTADFALDLVARGQTSFGQPLFLSEQFALDAASAVSSFPGGSFNADSGATLRGELRYPPMALRGLHIAPYLFGAHGWGWLARPAAGEQAFITAAAAGLGTRVNFAGLPGFRRLRASLGFEFGHQFSNVAGRASGDRASLTVAIGI